MLSDQRRRGIEEKGKSKAREKGNRGANFFWVFGSKPKTRETERERGKSRGFFRDPSATGPNRSQKGMNAGRRRV